METEKNNKGSPEYWRERVHEPDQRCRYWWSEQQHFGERHRIHHKAAQTKREAAFEAARTWLDIQRDGWDRYSPDPLLKAFIKATQAIFERNGGNLKTFNEYLNALRRIVAFIKGLGILSRSTCEKDRTAWERLIDEQKFSVLSLKAIRNYMREAGASAAGNLRLAKCLFRPEIRAQLHWSLPDPFSSIALGPSIYCKFKPKIENFMWFTNDLFDRWPKEDLTGKKIFCLIAFEGLERNQIDVLKWSDFKLLSGECELFERQFDMRLYLDLWNHRGPNEHVIWASRSTPSVNAHSYRLDPEFKALAKQLRAMGVIEKRPLEYLKLECDAWKRNIYNPGKIRGVPYRKSLQ